VRLRETPVAGVYFAEPERIEDERGFFARTFSAAEFAARGLDTRVEQCSTSFNARRGTLRGLHFQAAPHGEAKLVRCTRGAIFDVAVDLRPASPTRCAWVGVRLDPESGRALYIPEGCAHGFQTLEDESDVTYMISMPYAPESAAGVRWDDGAFGIDWPPAVERIIGERDRSWPDFEPQAP
jgi:dTDP-4-dehydrorhamnose 3,5-epimerase